VALANGFRHFPVTPDKIILPVTADEIFEAKVELISVGRVAAAHYTEHVHQEVGQFLSLDSN
jgi:hypothetical protein